MPTAGGMDLLDGVSSLPIDLSSVFASPQNLLVVTTPASSSIVTQAGAILSPQQTAEALGTFLCFRKNSYLIFLKKTRPRFTGAR